jgi:transcriptional regulator with XRE-family HTH domain
MKLRFVNKIFETRIARGIRKQGTFLAVLRDAGVKCSRTTLSSWESGKCSPRSAETRAHIAEVIQVPVDSLFHYVEKDTES